MIAAPRVPGVPEPDTPHVLVVEDDNAVRRAFSRMLAGAGFDVETAADGQVALTRVAAQQYDAIVCDVVMPNMDGMELYKRLQADHPRAASNVVFVTGWSELPPVATFLGNSGRPHLKKPVDRNALLGAVRGLTAETVQRRETLTPFTPGEAKAIREAIGTEGEPLRCPRCGRELETGLPMGGGSIALVWFLSCTDCQRSMIVRDLPDPPKPHAD